MTDMTFYAIFHTIFYITKFSICSQYFKKKTTNTFLELCQKHLDA